MPEDELGRLEGLLPCDLGLVANPSHRDEERKKRSRVEERENLSQKDGYGTDREGQRLRRRDVSETHPAPISTGASVTAP